MAARRTPIPHDDLRDLFAYLDEELASGYACPTTLLRTKEFLLGRGIAVARAVKWLLANGGGCDCEVMMNVAFKWAVVVGYGRPDRRPT